MNADLLDKATWAARRNALGAVLCVAIEACAEVAEDCDARGLGVTNAAKRIRALAEPTAASAADALPAAS